VIRVAEREDLEKMESLRTQAREETTLVRDKAAEHELTMHVVGAEYNLEGSQLTVYFTAEGGGRVRALRRTPLLQLVADQLPHHLHQDGEGAGPAPQSHQDLGSLRASPLLPRL
jgi:hypothetical protein